MSWVCHEPLLRHQDMKTYKMYSKEDISLSLTNLLAISQFAVKKNGIPCWLVRAQTAQSTCLICRKNGQKLDSDVSSPIFFLQRISHNSKSSRKLLLMETNQPLLSGKVTLCINMSWTARILNVPHQSSKWSRMPLLIEIVSAEAEAGGFDGVRPNHLSEGLLNE